MIRVSDSATYQMDRLYLRNRRGLIWHRQTAETSRVETKFHCSFWAHGANGLTILS